MAKNLRSPIRSSVAFTLDGRKPDEDRFESCRDRHSAKRSRSTGTYCRPPTSPYRWQSPSRLKTARTDSFREPPKSIRGIVSSVRQFGSDSMSAPASPERYSRMGCDRVEYRVFRRFLKENRRIYGIGFEYYRLEIRNRKRCRTVVRKKVSWSDNATGRRLCDRCDRIRKRFRLKMRPMQDRQNLSEVEN